jgi:hypothetical protein
MGDKNGGNEKLGKKQIYRDWRKEKFGDGRIEIEGIKRIRRVGEKNKRGKGGWI